MRGFTPKIGKNCFLADNAAIIGDTTIGDDCSIWFGTVLRGDVNTITIGNCVNIQDGSVLHTLYQKSTIEIGNHVSVGHNVTIHGAKVHVGGHLASTLQFYNFFCCLVVTQINDTTDERYRRLFSTRTDTQ